MTVAPSASSAGPLERWLTTHATALAVLFVALGLLARLRAAHAPFLAPDEALHLQIAASEDLGAVYRGSLGNAHPPLFFFLLHGWRRLARTDWQLRLLPVAFGAAFLWSAWRWSSESLGRAAGLIALACLAFLPSIVLVSSELRAYALLLWLVASALWALEGALARSSPPRLWLFTGLSAAALLTHYAAFRFVAAAGVYAAVRLWAARRPRGMLSTWAAGQAILGALAAFLLATHVAKLHGGALEREVQSTWLRDSYWLAPENPLSFLLRQTLALFQYFFSSPAAGAVALILFAGGVAWLAARRRPEALLLGVPFALAALGGLLRAYPYGGTRHSADLSLFACAGVGVALARLSGERLWVAVAVGAALAAGGFLVSGS